MNKTSIKEFLRPIIIFFILINALCFSAGRWLDAKNIDHIILIYANLILFFLALGTSFVHIKALRNNNPYAFVRGVTASAIIKLVVIAASVAVYLTRAGENRSIYALAAAMAIYIVYTIFEVNGAMRMNRKKNVQS
jgi:hypothetical protein